MWSFFLGTGFRESEVAVAQYSDINLETGLIQVVEKPEFDFRPKDCEKRLVPVPDHIIEVARKFPVKNRLIFGCYSGQPDGHLLRRLKRIAVARGWESDKWILHRFRKNFATDRHQAGASARQIQKWLGHSSLETTLRYLATMDDTSDEVREVCNSTHAGL